MVFRGKSTVLSGFRLPVGRSRSFHHRSGIWRWPPDRVNPTKPTTASDALFSGRRGSNPNPPRSTNTSTACGPDSHPAMCVQAIGPIAKSITRGKNPALIETDCAVLGKSKAPPALSPGLNVGFVSVGRTGMPAVRSNSMLHPQPRSTSRRQNDPPSDVPTINSGCPADSLGWAPQCSGRL